MLIYRLTQNKDEEEAYFSSYDRAYDHLRVLTKSHERRGGRVVEAYRGQWPVRWKTKIFYDGWHRKMVNFAIVELELDIVPSGLQPE